VNFSWGREIELTIRVKKFHGKDRGNRQCICLILAKSLGAERRKWFQEQIMSKQLMISIIYKVVYSFLKIYWFVLRPKTQGVTCLILSGDELLLVRHTYGRSAWTLSGGGLKKNESKEEAVKREVKEELGLEITPEYIGEFTHNPEHKIDTVFCFVARVEKEEPKIDHLEIKEAKWWNINNLPKDRSASLQRVMLMHESR
jgi:8-oxo-dGTP diphosphatase